MSPGEQSSSCRASSSWHSPCERSCLGAGGGPTLLTPWPAGSLRRHPEARGDERRTPALRSLARPRRAPRAHRTRSSEGRRRTTRAARAVAAGCRASRALAPLAGVYDRPCPPLTGGSGGADRSARSASLRASRPPSATACSSPTSSIHASTSSSRGPLVGQVDNDRCARPFGRELVFERVEMGREQAAAQLPRRLPGNLDDPLARGDPNRGDSPSPHRVRGPLRRASPLVPVRLGLLAEPEPLADLRHEASHGENLRPVDRLRGLWRFAGRGLAEQGELILARGLCAEHPQHPI